MLHVCRCGQIYTCYNKNCGLYDSLQRKSQLGDSSGFHRHDFAVPNKQKRIPIHQHYYSNKYQSELKGIVYNLCPTKGHLFYKN